MRDRTMRKRSTSRCLTGWGHLLDTGSVERHARSLTPLLLSISVYSVHRKVRASRIQAIKDLIIEL